MSRNYEAISFQVRIRESVSAADLKHRLEQILGCSFVLGKSEQRLDSDVYTANSLGLSLELIDMSIIEKETAPGQYFCLMGFIPERVFSKWPDEVPTTSITRFILSILHTEDSSEWFAHSSVM